MDIVVLIEVLQYAVGTNCVKLRLLPSNVT